MRLYLDTADTQAWDALMPLGLFHGITTNPLLATRAGLHYPRIDWAEMAGRAHDLGAQELHVQLSGPVAGYRDMAAGLYETGRSAGIEVVIKVPLVAPAIAFMPALKALDGRILMTACYDAKQMIVAVAQGADFIAPYYGRMIEAGIDADAHLAAMLAIGAQAEQPCEILVASLRSPDQIVALAAAGQRVFTIAPPVAEGLLSDTRSQAALEEFEANAR